jgi:membrane protease YdiL (CAAX protease family)
MASFWTSNQSPERPQTDNPVEHSLNAASAIQPRNEYLRITKTLTYSYLFTLPLFVLYELGIIFVNMGNPRGVRIGAQVWIQQLLELVGLHGTIWLAILVLIAGAIIVVYERKQKIPLRPRWFGLMFIESALYAVVLGFLVGSFVSQMFGLAMLTPTLQIAGREGLTQGLVLSLGAGIYEELVFRLILVTLLVGMLRLVPMSTKMRSAIAMVVAALIFSWVHYIGALGDAFTISSFTFRFLMGLALNLLFLTRGFGIAAMTHALYDVRVTVMQ